MTEKEVRVRLRAEVKQFPTQRAAAQKLRITQSYLNDILHGRRRIGPKVLRALGLVKIESSERVG